MKKATINTIEEILNHHAGGLLINVCGWLLAHQYPIAINGMSRMNKDSIYLFNTLRFYLCHYLFQANQKIYPSIFAYCNLSLIAH